MMEIHLDINGVKVDVKGETGDIMQVLAGMNEIVDRIKKAAESLVRLKK